MGTALTRVLATRHSLIVVTTPTTGATARWLGRARPCMRMHCLRAPRLAEHTQWHPYDRVEGQWSRSRASALPACPRIRLCGGRVPVPDAQTAHMQG